MRPDIAPGGTFPDYELPDHTKTMRKLSEIYNGYWYWGRPSAEDLRRDLRAATREIRHDWDLGDPGPPRGLGGRRPRALPHGWSTWNPERVAAERARVAR
jgi:hypothetical protein